MEGDSVNPCSAIHRPQLEMQTPCKMFYVFTVIKDRIDATRLVTGEPPNPYCAVRLDGATASKRVQQDNTETILNHSCRKKYHRTQKRSQLQKQKVSWTKTEKHSNIVLICATLIMLF